MTNHKKSPAASLQTISNTVLKTLRPRLFFTSPLRLCALLLITALVLSSCSVRKRVYMRGFHVSWKQSKKSTERHESLAKQNKPDNKRENDQIAELSLLPDEKTESQSLTASAGKTPVKFHHKTRSLNIKNAAAENKFTQNARTSKIKKEAKKAASPSGGGKSQLVALVLCFLVGVIGVHRFYLGYIGIGIIQLITLGGCGIWALVDLIMIITGDLKPKNSEYEDTI